MSQRRQTGSEGSAVLVIETVGTQEIQLPYFEDAVAKGLGPEPRVKGRVIGEELEKLSDEALLAPDVLGESYEVFRNGPCYKEIDRHYETWTLGLIATDQHPPHESDTIGIARTIARWFQLQRSHVEVLEPIALSLPPHQPSDELAATLLRCVEALLEQTRPTTVIVLPVGGTPAMRLLTERAVALRFHDQSRRLVPDGSGDFVAEGLFRILEADHLRELHVARLVEAVVGGRYRAARDRAADIRALHLLPGMDERLESLCVAAERIARNHPHWIPSDRRKFLDRELLDSLMDIKSVGHGYSGRLMARIGLVDRAERDGRLDEALIHWVGAAELLPLVWVAECGEVKRSGDLETLVDEMQALRRRGTCVGPFFAPGVKRKPRASRKVQAGRRARAGQLRQVEAARQMAACARIRCSMCPMRNSKGDSLVGRLWEQDERGASVLRDTGPRALNELRNAIVHGDFNERNFDQALAQEAQALSWQGAKLGKPTLAGLLRAAFERVAGYPPNDPYAVLDDHIDAALALAGVERGGQPAQVDSEGSGGERGLFLRRPSILRGSQSHRGPHLSSTLPGDV